MKKIQICIYNEKKLQNVHINNIIQIPDMTSQGVIHSIH